jgi:hypothetical protein
MTQTAGYIGNVLLTITELTTYELSIYCNSSNLTAYSRPPLIVRHANDTNFTTHFSYITFTSGCYWYDPATNNWRSEGVDVMSDTNLKFTHCVTTHLTEFAGGWLVAPASINWDYVFSNFSFDKNPTLFSTVIGIYVLFVLFLIWGRYMDRQDLKKIGVSPLPDNNPSNKYLYEVIVFTGSRYGAGTDSKVMDII